MTLCEVAVANVQVLLINNVHHCTLKCRYMSSTSQCWPNPWILSSLERESLLIEPINSDHEDGYLKVKNF